MKNKSLIWITILILLLSSIIPIVSSYKTYSNKTIYVGSYFIEDGKPKGYLYAFGQGELNNNISIEINGGIGVEIIIKNNGDFSIYDLDINIILDSFWMIAGGETTTTISDLLPHNEIIVTTGFLLGFGSFEITINILDISETRNGFIIGPFVLLKRDGEGSIQ